MKRLATCIIIIFICFNLSALETSLRITPQFTYTLDKVRPTSIEDIVPKDLRRIGFGALVNTDFNFFNFLNIGPEFSYVNTPQIQLPDNFNLISAGLSVGGFFYPLTRLHLGLSASAGVNLSFINSKSIDIENFNLGYYYRGWFEAGYRFSTSFVLALSGGYQSYYTNKFQPITSTIFAGITTKFNFTSGTKFASNLSIAVEQDIPVYPCFSKLYEETPIAFAVLQNTGTAELTDVKVYFTAGKYSKNEKECFSVDKLYKRESIDIPIYSSFSDRLLQFSEDGKISGEVIIDYKLLGKKMHEVKEIVIDVYNRNAFNWSDPAGLASFISSSTDEILSAAKYIAGVQIENLKPGMNEPFQYAAAIMEGLRLAGITYSEDTLTPYTSYHLSDENDYVQYPLQTLNLLSGDYDDLGILVCSCLESFGISTGYLLTEDDFIVLVATGITPGKEKNQFAFSGLYIDDNNVWLGLSMASFNKGFSNSRIDALKKISALQKEESENFVVIDTEAAHEYYPSIDFSNYTGAYRNPSPLKIIENVNTAMNYYVKSELNALIVKFKKTGETKKLADTYFRAGMYSEALQEYQKLNTEAAMNNIALIYKIQKKYKQAYTIYQQVLQKNPENKVAANAIEVLKPYLEVSN